MIACFHLSTGSYMQCMNQFKHPMLVEDMVQTQPSEMLLNHWQNHVVTMFSYSKPITTSLLSETFRVTITLYVVEAGLVEIQRVTAMDSSFKRKSLDIVGSISQTMLLKPHLSHRMVEL